MGRGSIDNLLEIGWIKPKGRKSVPGRPTTWATTELFLENFGLEDIHSLPNMEELKASGFLDKRSAISKITDLADHNSLENNELLNNGEDNSIEDFIKQKTD